MGNALGGIRTPAIDAPVGAYYGTNTCNPAFLGFLSGWYVPFDAATLAKLYPTHEAYVARVTASANKAVADGFMLQDDAQRLINEADASSVGKLGAHDHAVSALVNAGRGSSSPVQRIRRTSRSAHRARLSRSHTGVNAGLKRASVANVFLRKHGFPW